jgi:hypothetical protein
MYGNVSASSRRKIHSTVTSGILLALDLWWTMIDFLWAATSLIKQCVLIWNYKFFFEGFCNPARNDKDLFRKRKMVSIGSNPNLEMTNGDIQIRTTPLRKREACRELAGGGIRSGLYASSPDPHQRVECNVLTVFAKVTQSTVPCWVNPTACRKETDMLCYVSNLTIEL